jgi:hypothetical protein
MRSPTEKEIYLEDLRQGTLVQITYDTKKEELILMAGGDEGGYTGIIVLALNADAAVSWPHRLNEKFTRIEKRTHHLAYYKAQIVDRSDLPLYMDWVKGAKFEAYVQGNL